MYAGPFIIINTVIILLFYFFLASCDECQRNSHLRKVPAVLQPIPPPDSSFKQFGIDLVGPLQKTKPDEYRYVIVLTDYLTKWPEAEAIKNKEASTVAKFITKVVCRYSDAKVIITDQGREFCNVVNDDICRRLGIDHRRTTAYHPQSKGQTERYNQTLCNSLVKYLNDEQDNWDDFIDPVLLAYRTSVHKSTKKAPYFLAFGKELTLLIEEQFAVNGFSEGASDEDLGCCLDTPCEATSKLFNCHTEAKDNIEEAQSTHKKYYDAKHLPPRYKVGDKVLLNNARRKQRLGDKLTPRWTEPYVIGEIPAKGIFRLKGQKPLVNAKLIKPYLKARRRLSKSKTSPPPTTPSNSTASPPEDEACQETAYEPAPDVQFDSVGEQWQARADSLQCKIWKNLKTEGPSRMGHEHEPGVTARILGDGNCFFHTLSYFLTGAQREHQRLRALLCQFMRENNDQFNAIANQKDYVITNKVFQLGEYATEVEIFGAATFLGTPIWTFSPYGDSHRQQCHRPVSELPSPFSLREGMYIKNMHEHFEPVLVS